MTDQELFELKFPIGEFERPAMVTPELINDWIQTIAQFPAQLKNVVDDLSSEESIWRYRPNGWTISQVVHHCADSHMNAYLRFKWSLTENTPAIKGYDEGAWAMLPDANNCILIHSLVLIEGLHARWSETLRSMTAEQFEREYYHPEHDANFKLSVALANYAWHCEHHLAHITNGIASKGIYNE